MFIDRNSASAWKESIYVLSSMLVPTRMNGNALDQVPSVPDEATRQYGKTKAEYVVRELTSSLPQQSARAAPTAAGVSHADKMLQWTDYPRGIRLISLPTAQKG
jgi:hypothetical protein